MILQHIKEKIENLSEKYFEEVRKIRHHLHQYPELSLKETGTAAFISDKLTEMKIQHTTGIAGTGITGIIEGKNPSGGVVALRADMDALPIEEDNDMPWKSKNPGIMHACGHDVHMSCLLGAAKILNELKHHWSGTVKLIFQPSEESYPGGASLMIKEGVLNNPAPGSIIGQHVSPLVESGKVGIRSGLYMASTDEIYLTIKGKGGHAATPHMVTDTVLIASHIIVAMQQVVSRNAKPWTPSVLSFGRFIANGRMNIIPGEVHIDGTFRTFDEGWRIQAHEKLTMIATETAKAMGATCETEIKKGYPFLKNNPEMADLFRRAAADYLGEDKIVELEPSMTAEDFSFYSQQIPACFYRLGTRNDSKGIVSNVHTSTFDIDEAALKTGMGLLAYFSLLKLDRGK